MLIAVLGLGFADARSDQTDPRLKGLFEQLKTASSPEAAAPVEAEIWTIWAESGDSDLNQVFKVGSRAMAIGDVATALKIFDAIVHKAPAFAEGWNKRATVLYLAGEFQRSLADCAEVLKRNPRHFGALSGAGLIHLQLEQYGQALDSFRRALEVNPNMTGIEMEVRRLEALLRGRAT